MIDTVWYLTDPPQQRPEIVNEVEALEEKRAEATATIVEREAEIEPVEAVVTEMVGGIDLGIRMIERTGDGNDMSLNLYSTVFYIIQHICYNAFISRFISR